MISKEAFFTLCSGAPLVPLAPCLTKVLGLDTFFVPDIFPLSFPRNSSQEFGQLPTQLVEERRSRVSG